MAKIANPIYDTVFKYLVEDNKAAKFLLSAMLGTEIYELEMRQHEYVQKIKDDLKLMRIDFGAKIKDLDGNYQIVTIELQKARLEGDVLRFRQYLASQYKDEKNIIEINGRSHAIPIVSIYILGYPCCNIEEPVIYEVPEFYNAENQKITDVKSEFIFGLIHKMIIVQIPYLRKKVKTRVEQLLSIFDQNYKVTSDTKYPRVLDVPENEDDKQYNYLVRRLIKANSEEEIVSSMEVEDQIYYEFDLWEKRVNFQQEQLDKAKELLVEQKNQLVEQKNQINEQKSQIDEQKSQIDEQKNQLIEKDKRMAKKLLSLGNSIEEISEFLSIDIQKVKEYLK
ncbi:MAG: hypothetical protein MJ211_10740 [Bacteroidales bacterium]|nr:hypothetical protein [Bacteroidales bacterium]